MIKTTGFLVLFFLFIVAPHTAAGSPMIELDEKDTVCLEKTIYLNECASKPANLIIWPPDEDFPSLGIGHFIWYPLGKKGPYQETFPELILFMRLNGQSILPWLDASADLPWNDRDSYLRDAESERVQSLRQFLLDTRVLQTKFIIDRVRRSLPELLTAVPDAERPAIEARLARVLSVPNGPLAVIDYINFKGEGIRENERFRGQGWGLLQVLQEMNDTEKKDEFLPEFVRAAKAVLDRRTANAPAGSKEKDRIGGWKFRVQRYLTLSC